MPTVAEPDGVRRHEGSVLFLAGEDPVILVQSTGASQLQGGRFDEKSSGLPKLRTGQENMGVLWKPGAGRRVEEGIQALASAQLTVHEDDVSGLGYTQLRACFLSRGLAFDLARLGEKRDPWSTEFVATLVVFNQSLVDRKQGLQVRGAQ